ncbi:hypothetical protein [Streptomyces sp. WMMB303]|uniref:lipase/acyltransferase domain-containing protein n=1 Tax=Streptomyces sp. WMMB303 TaxID=3034154 RepID=UPI0023ED80CD|nr:hypothetical protein [Streptomyces sp. WMMB303]MDF4250941.1 hypothetical protein [Streptomyces sp. WMMB303]
MSPPSQWNAATSLAPAVTHDAIVIVPGIMGSELINAGGEVLWGLSHPRWLAKAWLSRSGLGSLHVTDAERAGEPGSVRASRLLRFPTWIPFVGGVEPYTRLVEDAGAVAAHPRALRTFPYDWRLPVRTNARLLAQEARRHLEEWRAHPAHAQARRLAVDEREARLVFVAHSMGGLVTYAALALGGDSELAAETRGVMTLGTPFQGSVDAACILNGVQGAPLPLPHRKLAALAATMPGVHDLLPRHLCVEDGTEVRRLTSADVAALGGDKDLNADAEAFRQKLLTQPLPCHRQLVGIQQRTAASMTLEDGVVRPAEYSFRSHTDGELLRDRHGVPRRFPVQGDGTVHRASASLLSSSASVPFALQHGTLASDKAARLAVVDFLLEEDPLGPDQADGALGLQVPDYVVPGAEWQVDITGTDDPSGVECTLSALDGDGWSREGSPYADGDDLLRVDLRVPRPGLYRLTVTAPYSPTTLTQLVFAGPDGTADGR